MKKAIGSILLLVAALTIAGCGRSKEPAPSAPAPAPSSPVAEPVGVIGVTLGRAIGADKKVVAATDTFAPGDTIYASIDTQGAATTASLSVRWMFEGGQLVREESMSISPNGPATSEFHVSKPDGWPKGGYTVQILLDGVPVRTASFRVS